MNNGQPLKDFEKVCIQVIAYEVRGSQSCVYNGLKIIIARRK